MQEFLIRLICWIPLVFFGYILLVCILAEMSLGRPKIKDGVLQVRRDSFVIRVIFRANLFENDDDKEYPHNICQLFWGIFRGVVASTINLIFVLIIGCFLLAAFFAGFTLNWWEDNPRFLTYQTYLKKDSSGKIKTKKFIAPWKFVAGFLIWYQFAQHPDRTFGFIGNILMAIPDTVVKTIDYGTVPAGIVIGIIFAAVFLFFVFTSTCEFLKSKKKKVCIDVDLV